MALPGGMPARPIAATSLPDLLQGVAVAVNDTPGESQDRLGVILGG